MYLSYEQEISWLKSYAQELDKLIRDSIHALVICPSAISLEQAVKLSSNAHFNIGAQDCSAYDHGAYTGQIAAQSLRQIGCTHCIIGHSETRELLNQTNEIIAKKLKRTIENHLIPIIAIGEPEHDYKQGRRKAALFKQLYPIIEAIKKLNPPSLLIAYEPVWAIGTGNMAKIEDIKAAFEDIKDISQETQLAIPIKLLYGGSIKSNNTKELLSINQLDGFLIGSASTDFQELKKIVSLIASAD